MASLTLKNIMKIYPHSNDQKKPKKGQPEKKINLQVDERGVIAVQQFNLDVKDKEFIVLVGPSGCGKSTTLRMVAGLEEIRLSFCLIYNNLYAFAVQVYALHFKASPVKGS